MLTLGREPGGPPPTEGHSFCHFSKLFEAVKSRNGVGDAITSAPLAALIEPFQMHFAFMESSAPANIYLCCYWLRKTKLGVEGGSEFLTLQGYRRCGQSLRSGIKYQTGSRHNGEESAKGGRRLDCYSKCSWPRQIKRFSPGGQKAQSDGEGAACPLKIGVFFFFFPFVERRRNFLLISEMKRKLEQFQ